MNAHTTSVSNVPNSPPNISQSLIPDRKFDANPPMKKLPSTAPGGKKEKKRLTLLYEKKKNLNVPGN